MTELGRLETGASAKLQFAIHALDRRLTMESWISRDFRLTHRVLMERVAPQLCDGVSTAALEGYSQNVVGLGA
jgi:hypothetical protein